MSIVRTINMTISGIELEVSYEYSPAVPGKLDGAWEDSYPEEAESVHIISVIANGDMSTILDEKTLIEIEQKAIWTERRYVGDE